MQTTITRRATKITSLLLTVIMLLSMFGELNLTAFAATDQNVLTVKKVDFHSVTLSVPLDTQTLCYSIQRSYNKGVNWERISSYVGDEYDESIKTLEIQPNKPTYFRLEIEHRKPLANGSYTILSTEYSKNLIVYPDVSKMLDDNISYYQSQREVNFNISYKYSEDEYIDGYYIYKSVNAAGFKKAKTISVKQDTYSEKLPNAAAVYVRYRIIPYYIDDKGTVHANTNYGKVFTAKYTNVKKLATALPKKNTVEVKILKPVKSAKYKIEISRCKKEKFKYSKYKTYTITSKKKTVIKKLNHKRYNYKVRIRPLFGKFKGEAVEYDPSLISDYVMDYVPKSKTKSVKVVNSLNKKDKKEKSLQLSKEDKKLIKAFLNKYTKKSDSRYEKARKAFLKILFKTRNDAHGKNKNLSDTKAVFKKRCASTSQANRAYAKLLTYLGYDVRIIKGMSLDVENIDYDNYKEIKVRKDWIEINVFSNWYLIDLSLDRDASVFCEDYSRTWGYFYKNGKSVKR